MERRYSPQDGAGQRSQWFTSGITRRFGRAPAAASGRATECCGERMWRSCPTQEYSGFSSSAGAADGA
ncbi:hypothetical protein [Desulfosporosinus shakirovi]|uniref:hypothetical protein n=1 Tax=Desulfosporosinus shakirovi TaxID=2885154 RepID=UPI001E5366D0|nr:hypothetical protein [Desulfosporosinus sp. SRJS8]MCB8816717.1 hypothetical protein [Desulfosporosinus sp. SRJS8]